MNRAVGFIDWLDAQWPRAEAGISASAPLDAPKEKENTAKTCTAGV